MPGFLCVLNTNGCHLSLQEASGFEGNFGGKPVCTVPWPKDSHTRLMAFVLLYVQWKACMAFMTGLVQALAMWGIGTVVRF